MPKHRVFKDDPLDGVVRLPKNISERALYDKMTGEGWEVVRRGWPDFACFRGDEFIVVEVKRNDNYFLKKTQYHLMAALAARGIECYLWNLEKGFTKVTPKG